MKNTKLFFLLSISFIIGFYSLLGYLSNLFADDFYFISFFKTHPHSLKSLFAFIHENYTNNNARFGQYLCGIYFYLISFKNIWVWSVFLPLLHTLNLWLLFIFIYKRSLSLNSQKDLLRILSLFCLYTLGVSGAGGTLFWFAGALNHSVALMLILLMLIPFKLSLTGKSFFKENSCLFNLFCLICFLAGMSNEVIAVCIILFVIYTLYRIKKTYKQGISCYIVGLVFYLIGWMILINAPATASRQKESGGSLSLTSIKTYTDYLFQGFLGHSYANIFFFTLIILSTLYLVFRFKNYLSPSYNKLKRTTLRLYKFFVLSLLASTPMILSSKETLIQANGYFLASIISIIGIMYFFEEFIPSLAYQNSLKKDSSASLEKISAQYFKKSKKYLFTFFIFSFFILLYILINYFTIHKIQEKNFTILKNSSKRKIVKIYNFDKDFFPLPFQIFFQSHAITNTHHFFNRNIAKIFHKRGVSQRSFNKKYSSHYFLADYESIQKYLTPPKKKLHKKRLRKRRFRNKKK